MLSFDHLVRDPALILLVAGSLLSWAIIADRLLALRRSRAADDAYLDGRPAPNSPQMQLRDELARWEGADREHLLGVMDAAITRQRHALERGLPLLGVIGSIAPYVGLLGTVIGIIQAFQAISARNDMSPSVVAGGISTALIATALGLAVAIPAVAASHLFAAAIARRVALWEAAVLGWLSRPEERESKVRTREPFPLG